MCDSVIRFAQKAEYLSLELAHGFFVLVWLFFKSSFMDKELYCSVSFKSKGVGFALLPLRYLRVEDDLVDLL